MRQMYCTVARETKLTLGVALCVKSCQEDTKCAFQRGKGQNMQHFKGEDYLFESVELEMKMYGCTPTKIRGQKNSVEFAVLITVVVLFAFLSWW